MPLLTRRGLAARARAPGIGAAIAAATGDPALFFILAVTAGTGAAIAARAPPPVVEG